MVSQSRHLSLNNHVIFGPQSDRHRFADISVIQDTASAAKHVVTAVTRLASVTAVSYAQSILTTPFCFIKV